MHLVCRILLLFFREADYNRIQFSPLSFHPPLVRVSELFPELSIHGIQAIVNSKIQFSEIVVSLYVTDVDFSEHPWYDIFISKIRW